jgi:hypothetical protein
VITPDISLVHVLEFCRSISAEAVCYVPVQPNHGCKDGDCFNNVDAVTRQHGGAAVIGWHIIEWPGVFIEAEHHAVWHQSSGQLLDPTPQVPTSGRIAFLADPSLGEWDFPNNRNQASTPDPAVKQFLEATADFRREYERSGVVPNQLVRRAQALRERLASRFGPEPFDSG